MGGEGAAGGQGAQQPLGEGEGELVGLDVEPDLGGEGQSEKHRGLVRGLQPGQSNPQTLKSGKTCFKVLDGVKLSQLNSESIFS